MKTAVQSGSSVCAIGVFVLLSGWDGAYATAPDSLWMRAYGDTLQQQCRCIIETSDHGYAFTGSTKIPLVGAPGHYDVWVVRLDPDGDVVWDKHYGGSRCR